LAIYNTALVTAAGLDDGRFLVRTRDGNHKGEYVLCVVFKEKPTHHLITKTEDGDLQVNKKTFGGHKDVANLVDVLKTKQPGWPVPLDKPVAVAGAAAAVPAAAAAPKAKKGSVKKASGKGSYVHKGVSREECEALVTEAGLEDGRFLVRQTKPNQFAICVVYKGKPTHHLMVPNAEGFYTVNKKQFGEYKKPAEMIKHLSKKQAGWPVPLDKPVYVVAKGSEKKEADTSAADAAAAAEAEAAAAAAKAAAAEAQAREEAVATAAAKAAAAAAQAEAEIETTSDDGFSGDDFGGFESESSSTDGYDDGFDSDDAMFRNDDDDDGVEFETDDFDGFGSDDDGFESDAAVQEAANAKKKAIEAANAKKKAIEAANRLAAEKEQAKIQQKKDEFARDEFARATKQRLEVCLIFIPRPVEMLAKSSSIYPLSAGVDGFARVKSPFMLTRCC